MRSRLWLFSSILAGTLLACAVAVMLGLWIRGSEGVFKGRLADNERSRVTSFADTLYTQLIKHERAVQNGHLSIEQAKGLAINESVAAMPPNGAFGEASATVTAAVLVAAAGGVFVMLVLLLAVVWHLRAKAALRLDKAAQSLRGILESSAELAIALTGSETHAVSLAQQTDEAAGDISEMSKNMETLKGSARQTSSAVSSLVAATEQVLRNLSAMAVGAEDTSANINTVAAAVEEMNASLREVSRNCVQTAAAANTSHVKANEALEQISTLADGAKRIGKVVELIDDIADQTNLLALNATIEAASAGEAGRGFSVVANEVKALARQTAKATEEIAQYIEGMQNDTQVTVSKIREVTELSNDVNQLNDMIAAAVEQQTATTNEIARNVVAGADAASDISQSVQEMLTGAQEISDYTMTVSSSVGHFSESIDDIKDRFGDARALMRKLVDASARYSTTAGEINSSASVLGVKVEEASNTVAQKRPETGPRT